MPKKTPHYEYKGDVIIGFISFVVALIMSFIVYYLIKDLFSPLSQQINVAKVRLLFSVLFGFFSFGFSVHLCNLAYRSKQDYRTMIEALDYRLEHILEYFAISNSSEKFQKLLTLLRDPELGKIKWLVAKFLSEKIRIDFDINETKNIANVIATPNIDSSDFAIFAREITIECDISILWTCPFRPDKWFDTFTSKNIELQTIYQTWKSQANKIPKILAGQFSSELFPQLCGFLKSPIHHKLRIVNIDRTEWDAMKTDGQEIFDAFCLVNDSKRGHLWFLNTDELDGFGNEKNEDFALYDDKILLVHKPENKVLYLRYADVARYREFVTEAKRRNRLKSEKQVRKELWP